MSLKSLIVFAFLCLPGVVLAQPGGGDTSADANDPGVVYKQNTEYDFEDDLVEGSFVRPEGDYLDARRRGRYNSLIRIRENFVPEMLKSAEDI